MFELNPGETYYDLAKRFDTPEGRTELLNVSADIAKYHDIPIPKFQGLMAHESGNFNPLARNPKSSATGIGQFLNATATGEGFKVSLDKSGNPLPDDERWHPGRNMDRAAAYLKKLYNETGDWDSAIKRYGEGTDDYLDKVRASITKYEKEPTEPGRGMIARGLAGVKRGLARSFGETMLAPAAGAAPLFTPIGEQPPPVGRELIEKVTPQYTPPINLREEMAQMGGEAVGNLPALMALSQMTGGMVSPLTSHIGRLGTNILSSALPFAMQTMAAPEVTAPQIGAAGAAGAALPFIHPLPWYLRAPAAAGIGAGQAKLGTPEAGPGEMAKSGTLLALMSLLGRRQGYTAPRPGTGPIAEPAPPPVTAEPLPPFRGKVYSIGEKSVTYPGPQGDLELNLQPKRPLGYGELSQQMEATNRAAALKGQGILPEPPPARPPLRGTEEIISASPTLPPYPMEQQVLPAGTAPLSARPGSFYYSEGGKAMEPGAEAARLDLADLDRRVAMKYGREVIPEAAPVVTPEITPAAVPEIPVEAPKAGPRISPKELANIAIRSKDFESFNEVVGSRSLPGQVTNLQDFFDQVKGAKVPAERLAEVTRAELKESTPINDITYGNFIKMVINRDWPEVTKELQNASKRFNEVAFTDEFNPQNLWTPVAKEIKQATGFDDSSATHLAKEICAEYQSSVWSTAAPKAARIIPTESLPPSSPDTIPSKPYVIGMWPDPRTGIRFEHHMLPDPEVREGFRVVRQEFEGDKLLRQYAIATGTKDQVGRYLMTTTDPRWANANKYGWGYTAGNAESTKSMYSGGPDTGPMFQKLYDNHIKDWIGDYQARLTGKAPEGFDVWMTDAKDLNLLLKPTRLPVWVAKRFPGFAKAVDTSFERIEQYSGLSQNWLREAKPFLVDLPQDRLKLAETFLMEGDRIGSTREGIPAEMLTERLRAHRERVRTEGGEDVYQAYMSVRKALDMEWDEVEASFKRMGIPETEIGKLRQEMGYQPEYFPHSWGKGRYYVVARNQESGEPVFRSVAQTKSEARRVYREMASQYGDTNIEAGKNVNLPEDAFFGLNPEMAARIAKNAADRVKGLNPTQMDDLLQGIADTFKARGAMQHFIARQNVGGFRTEGLREVLVEHLQGAAGFVSKMEAVPKYLEALHGIDAKKQPNLYGFARNYIRDVLENTSRFDQALGTWRGIMFHKYLGFVPKTAWVNLTQNWTAFAPYMTGKEMKLADIKIGLAVKDVLSEFSAFRELHQGGDANFAKLAPVENQALRDLFHTGALNDWQTQELIGPLYGRGWSMLDRAFDASRWLFGTAEKLNRTSAGLCAFRYFFNDLKKTMGEPEAYAQAVKQSRDAINHTHYLMGKYNLPEVARGGTVQKMFRSSGYQFKGFTHNYLEMVANMVQESPKAALHAIRNITLLAGPLALPVVNEAYDVYKWFTGTDPLEDAFQNKEQDPAFIFTKYGLPGFLGVDVAKTIAPNVVMHDTPQDMIMNLTMGPFGATLFQELPQAYAMYKSGGGIRSLESVAPTVLKKAMKAYRESGEGVTTRRGQEVIDPNTGEVAKLTMGGAALTTAGFQPVSASIRREQQENLQRRMENRADMQDRLAARYVRALRSEDDGAMDQIWKEVDRYNEWAGGRGEPPIKLLDLVKDRLKGKMPPKSWRPYAYGTAE